MKFGTALVSSLIAILTLQSAHGEDTDIYLRSPRADAGSSMVMFTLDYRSNLGSTVCQDSACDSFRNAVSPSTGTTYLPATGTVSFFELLRAVLRKVTDELGPQINNVKFGIMLNHANENNCAGPTKTGCSNGAYVLMGFNTDKAIFHNKLAQIPTPHGNLSHPFQGKELYFELFRYLTGQNVYNGHNGWTDYATDKQQNLPNDNPNISWDNSVETGNRYISPLLGTQCSKVFVINFMFQVSQQESDSDVAITETKANGGMNQLNISGTNNNFSTVIRFMHDADLTDGTWGQDNPNLDDVQNVTSYFFVDPTKINQTTNGYAAAGGTNVALPLSNNPDELVERIKDILKQVLSISTTFVSAAVPVNVFNRTESLENVFYALFQPERTPRWNGNLKRLKLAIDENSDRLLVLDQNDNEAISATDGRIKNEALTFWTNASGADVVAADPSIDEISGKDGRSVSRGGAGQKIPGFLSGSPGVSNSDTGARKLFTEPDSYTNGTSTAFRALNADATTAGISVIWDKLKLRGADKSTSCSPSTDCWTTAASYAAALPEDQTMAVDLLKFARGLDAFDLDTDGSTTDVHPWATPSGQTTRKPWLMADPLHSKPTPINYGARSGYSNDVPDVRILLAGNDGYLHMFRNSASGSPTDESPSGVEDWAFLPRSLIGNLKLLAENGGEQHIYGLDGTAAVYINDTNADGTIESGEKVWAYIGMRRGGKGYYALDISNPDNPKMLWSITKTSGGVFDELGWTFSDPVVGSLNWGSGVKPVVIFAGGYDTNKDTRSSINGSNGETGTNDAEGNAIYIVDAETGALVWKAAKTCDNTPANQCYLHAGLLDSIPSSVTAVDTDSDGLIDRIVVGDTGGVVWRADLIAPPPPDPQNDPPVYLDKRSEWTIRPILSVGRHAEGQPDRRFFHRPDFVQAKDGTGNFDAVIIGSGDREHPLDVNVQNQFYMFKDRNTLSGNPPGTTKQVSDLDNLTNLGATASNECNCGWYIDLGLGADGGEKMLASPLTFLGKIFFSTYVPASQSDDFTCGPAEGKAYTYVVNLFTAAGVYDFDTSKNDVDGNPVNERAVESGSGIPSDPIYMSLGGKQFITPGNIPTEEKFRSPLESRAIWKTYWYEQE
ncbi:pilus assembly protein [Methylocaldum gracile]|jgi:type IV pilus assembly protein PilY1|uniref:pilus assembly protein n=1 Tax=Methylocaldum sp. 0917 TaxID=2485163 RepID=UPI0010E92BEF